MATKKLRRQQNRGTAGIRKIVNKHVSDNDDPYSDKQLDALLKSLKKKDRLKIVTAALKSHFSAAVLKPYQAELIKLQAHLETSARKAIILFDGRDASGKGGTIRRLTRYMNEKHYRVVALGKPSERQDNEQYMQRFIEQFPRAGEIVFF